MWIIDCLFKCEKNGTCKNIVLLVERNLDKNLQINGDIQAIKFD